MLLFMASKINTFFCGIGGSRSYNLEIENSDYDFLFISSECKEERSKRQYIDGYNVITSSSDFLYRVCYSSPYWAAWQYFFMKEYKSKNDFTTFIQENRDNFIYKNLPLVYQSYNDEIQKVRECFSIFSAVNRKVLYRAFLFLNILCDLPQGKEPIKCFRLGGEFHDFLINIRKGKYSEEYLWNEFLKLEEQKNKELKFYEAPRDEEFFRMVKNEIDKYNFLPYEEWKKAQNSLLT